MALPLTKGFTDTVSAPGASTSTLKLAPPEIIPPSKNEENAMVTDENMIGVMQELRLGVVQRNQALEEQLDVIRTRRDTAYDHLQKKIIPERENQQSQQRIHIANALEALEKEITERIVTWKSSHCDSLVPIHRQLDDDLGKETNFYKQEIPDRYERQCGTAIRTMEKEKEALALDNATIKAREAAIVERLDRHEQRYRDRNQAEINDREAQYNYYTKTFTYEMATWDDSQQRVQGKIDPLVNELHTSIKNESIIRKENDSLSVSTIRTAMEKIRYEAIRNFGEESKQDTNEDEENEDDNEDAYEE